MYSIPIILVDGHWRIRVLRWRSQGPYPVQLAEFELLDCTPESELALVARCARAVELQLEAMRSEEQPELPY